MAININNSANIVYSHGTNTDGASSNLVTTILNEDHGLTATKSSNNTTWRPSENLTYYLTVENTGVLPLYDVSVQDDLGTDVSTYLEGSARLIRNEEITSVTPTNTDPLTLVLTGILNPQEKIIYSYVARVNADIDSGTTQITNTVTAAGHKESAAGEVLTASPASLTLNRAQYADVRIEKAVDKQVVSSGDQLTYTFRLLNYGNIAATNVVITDALPTGYTIQSITSQSQGVTTTFDTTDYFIGEGNVLRLPTSTTKTISVPASTVSEVGLTTVTIIGTITS